MPNRHYILRSSALANPAAALFGTGYAPTAETRDGYPVIRGPRGHNYGELFKLLHRTSGGAVRDSDLIGPLDFAEAVNADYGAASRPRPATLPVG